MIDVESAPQRYARIGGVLYLGNIILGGVGQVVQAEVIVSGNPAATAAKIVSAESLWRLGIASEFVALVCATVLAMIYFVLFKPVSRELNLLATFLRLIAIAVEAMVAMNLFAALLVLTSTPAGKAFAPAQLDALANLAIRSYGYGFGVALLGFGFCFLVHGYLIMTSTFLPRTIGVLIQIAGLCYLANSLALFLAPSLEDRIFPAILAPAFVGELSLCLWLIVKGVDVDRWRAVDDRRIRAD
jgi:uncharacterized membrane protein